MKNNKNISYGDSSTNIGKAKKVVINYDAQQNVEVKDYKKKKIKDIKTSPKKISIVAILGLGATILTYVGVFIKFPILEMPRSITFLPLISAIFLITFVTAVILRRRKYIPLIGNYSIESDDKIISLKKTVLSCPKCNSKMRIFQNQNGVFASCHRNPEQHIFMYDYTTFTDTE